LLECGLPEQPRCRPGRTASVRVRRLAAHCSCLRQKLCELCPFSNEHAQCRCARRRCAMMTRTTCLLTESTAVQSHLRPHTQRPQCALCACSLPACDYTTLPQWTRLQHIHHRVSAYVNIFAYHLNESFTVLVVLVEQIEKNIFTHGRRVRGRDSAHCALLYRFVAAAVKCGT
jgi:hypothetical protein